MKIRYYICIISFLILPKGGFCQAILNTETLMKEIDSTIYYRGNLEGDFQFGNIKLIQFNSNILVGKKIGNHLFRGFVNYAYLSEGKKVLSSDISSQIRYNYCFNKHSIYAFFQLQNSMSLSLNRRLVTGGGFRQSVLKNLKNKNYLDLAYGFFFEEELYQESIANTLKVDNIRLSFASFSQFQVSENNRIMNVIYYQLNSNKINDYRVYIEPRFYHDWKKWSMYLKGMYRFHSTPYIDLIKYDSDIMIGLEIKI